MTAMLEVTYTERSFFGERAVTVCIPLIEGFESETSCQLHRTIERGERFTDTDLRNAARAELRDRLWFRSQPALS